MNDPSQGKVPKGSPAASPAPSVDKVLRHQLLQRQQQRVQRDYLATLTRLELARLKEELRRGQPARDLDEIAKAVVEASERLITGGVRRVINGTGIILNTNLGRAPLAGAVVERIAAVLTGYCSLEIDLESGKRGERTGLLEQLLSILVGCEAALVVNNNAAAVMLAVSALSTAKEVIVSRGELIEIGGSFRLPDVVVAAGGVLREVGTTNRTRIADYAAAIADNSGMLLRCHRSNFEISGFTEQASLPELVELSKSSAVPLIEDLGSGSILEISRWGFKPEPTVSSVLNAGVDLVMFSGDKLLGGVQAGIIVGKRLLVERLRSHPIYRAVRADKLNISLLEAVFAQYLAPEPQSCVPILKMATASAESLRERGQHFVTNAANQLQHLDCAVVEMTSAFGGGTLPGAQLPSFGICVVPRHHISANKLVCSLRAANLPVVAIITDGKVMIDFRTVASEEEDLLMQTLTEVDAQMGAAIEALVDPVRSQAQD